MMNAKRRSLRALKKHTRPAAVEPIKPLAHVAHVLAELWHVACERDCWTQHRTVAAVNDFACRGGTNPLFRRSDRGERVTLRPPIPIVYDHRLPVDRKSLIGEGVVRDLLDQLG